MSRIAHAPSRRISLGIVALAIGLIAASCGSEAKVSGTVVKDAQGCVTEVAHRSDVPAIAAGVKVGKKPASKDLKTNAKGCSPTGTGYLSLDLVGATATDAKVFTSTWDTKRPITAQVGQSTLLPGLEAQLADIKVGDRRQVTIPAAAAYGADGNPDQGIGPNEDLVFVVDLLSVTPKPRFCAAANGVPTEVDGKPIEDKPAIENPIEVPVGNVVTRDIKEGGVGAKATKSSYLVVNYVGIGCFSGTQFDSSWDKGTPLAVALGAAAPTESAAGVIAGWTDGLEGATAGTIRKLEIPAQLAYGAQGRGPDIQPDEALTFVVEIISISKKVPPATTTTSSASTTTAPAGSTTTAPAGTTTIAPADTTTTASRRTEEPTTTAGG